MKNSNQSQDSKTQQKPTKPLMQDKEAMREIVAKHEDVMGFFEKIKIEPKSRNIKSSTKLTKDTTKN